MSRPKDTRTPLLEPRRVTLHANEAPTGDHRGGSGRAAAVAVVEHHSAGIGEGADQIFSERLRLLRRMTVVALAVELQHRAGIVRTIVDPLSLRIGVAIHLANLPTTSGLGGLLQDALRVERHLHARPSEDEDFLMIDNVAAVGVQEADRPVLLPNQLLPEPRAVRHDQVERERLGGVQHDHAVRREDAIILGPHLGGRKHLVPFARRHFKRRVAQDEVHRLGGDELHLLNGVAVVELGEQVSARLGLSGDVPVHQSEALLDDRPVGRLALDHHRGAAVGHRRRASRARATERVQHHIAGIRTRQHDALDQCLRERAGMRGAFLRRPVDLREMPDVRRVRPIGIVALVRRLAGDTHVLQIEDRINLLGTTARALEGAGLHQIEPAFRAGREALGRALMCATIPDNLLNESQASARDQRKEVIGQRHTAVRTRLVHADVDPHRPAGLQHARGNRDPMPRELDVVLNAGKGVAVRHADVQVGRRRHDQINRASSHPIHGGDAFALQEASRGRRGRRRIGRQVVVSDGSLLNFGDLLAAGDHALGRPHRLLMRPF